VSDTGKGDVFLRGFVKDLTGLVDQLDEGMVPVRRLDVYRFIVVNGVFVTETAHALWHLWSEPGARLEWEWEVPQ
jgi:hypothetical protein